VQHEYVVVYGILEEGFSGMRLVIPLVWLTGLLIVGGFAVQALRRREYNSLVGMCLWLCFWACAGVFGVSNVIRQQWRCLEQARSGDFQVVQGEVRDYKPMPSRGKGSESFTVNGIHFSYSDGDLSRGGFNNAALHGGPIREGLYVRICHRDGRVLKIEVRK
jgi:hypothetical protein